MPVPVKFRSALHSCQFPHPLQKVRGRPQRTDDIRPGLRIPHIQILQEASARFPGLRQHRADGQQAVFRHMGSLPDIKFNTGSFLGKLIRAFSCGKYFIFCFYDLIADFITQGTGNFSGLCGKRVDHAHHQDRRCKRKWF